MDLTTRKAAEQFDGDLADRHGGSVGQRQCFAPWAIALEHYCFPAERGFRDGDAGHRARSIPIQLIGRFDSGRKLRRARCGHEMRLIASHKALNGFYRSLFKNS
jgi:hypothetical protein